MSKSVVESQNTYTHNFDKPSLAEVLPSILQLVKDGISIIPVRDKESNGRPAKTPYGDWKSSQTERADEGSLYQAMTTYDTTAVAAVCGEVSGRLECIDIDSKYKPGIDATVMQDLQKLYPDLYPLLRIHKTPSGGRHILYRIEDHDVEGSQKLAGRMASEEEKNAQLAKGRKRADSVINFIETRGEGGYFLLPPSLGYSAIQDVPIPLITWEERCSLINLCRSYDEVVKIKPTPKPTKAQDSYYTTNPFEDFNQRCDEVQLMEEFGWKLRSHSSSRFLWFTRPGKEKGVSASFNREKRIFFIFTSSTELDSNRGYNPASILAELRFNGDRKEAYRHLCERGYGQIKPNVEKAIVAKAINTRNNGPSNLSEQAKREIEVGKQQSEENHPFGEFWSLGEKVGIDLSKILVVLIGLGFRDHTGLLVKLDYNTRIINSSADEFNDIINNLRDYVKLENGDLVEDIHGAIEEKLSTKIKYVRARLPQLDLNTVLSDSNGVSYKCYQNCILKISAKGLSSLNYDWVSENGLFVFDTQVQPREFNIDQPSSGLFREYLTNATRYTDHVKNCIGYLAYEKKVKDSAYLIILTEEVPNIKDGGGSGKNVFTAMLSHTTSIHEVDGATVKTDEKLLQSWNGQKVFVMSDLRKNFYWPMLKNPVSDAMKVKKLYKNEKSIPFELSPKFVASTNFSFDISDGGLKRRARPIEFTNYYTANGGVKKVHGKMFPDDFDAADWMSYDEVIIECIQFHLQQNGQIGEVELSEGGAFKQMVLKYGEDLMDEVDDMVDDLIENEPIGFSRILKERVSCLKNTVQKITSFQVYELIEYFATEKGYVFDRYGSKGTNNATGKRENCYSFLRV